MRENLGENVSLSIPPKSFFVAVEVMRNEWKTASILTASHRRCKTEHKSPVEGEPFFIDFIDQLHSLQV
jgi:hypothetical protein